MQTIQRNELKKMIERGAEFDLVELLAPKAYEHAHLPGAINIPFDDQFEHKIQLAIDNKSRTVVVYCTDLDCDASPKAGQAMEQLGYTHVYDYQAGKADWMRAGLDVVHSNS